MLCSPVWTPIFTHISCFFTHQLFSYTMTLFKTSRHAMPLPDLTRSIAVFHPRWHVDLKLPALHIRTRPAETTGRGNRVDKKGKEEDGRGEEEREKWFYDIIEQGRSSPLAKYSRTSFGGIFVLSTQMGTLKKNTRAQLNQSALSTRNDILYSTYYCALSTRYNFRKPNVRSADWR